MYIMYIINPRPEGYGSRFVVHSLTLGRRVTVVVLSFYLSICQPRYREQRSLLRASYGTNRLSTSMACNLTVDFAKMLSFSSYGWLTVIALLDSSEDRKAHSWLPRHL